MNIMSFMSQIWFIFYDYPLRDSLLIEAVCADTAGTVCIHSACVCESPWLQCIEMAKKNLCSLERKFFTHKKHICWRLKECRNLFFRYFHVSKSGELLEFNPRRSLDQSSIPCKKAAGNILWLLPASSFKMTLENEGLKKHPSIIEQTPKKKNTLSVCITSRCEKSISSHSSPPPVEVVFCAS